MSFTVPAARFAAGNTHARLLSRIAGLAEHFHFHPGLGSASKVLSVVEYPAGVSRRGAEATQESGVPRAEPIWSPPRQMAGCYREVQNCLFWRRNLVRVQLELDANSRR